MIIQELIMKIFHMILTIVNQDQIQEIKNLLD